MFRLNINSCPIGTLGFWRKNKIKNKRFKNRCVKCVAQAIMKLIYSLFIQMGINTFSGYHGQFVDITVP
jgi:hypothetical protein